MLPLRHQHITFSTAALGGAAGAGLAAAVLAAILPARAAARTAVVAAIRRQVAPLPPGGGRAALVAGLGLAALSAACAALAVRTRWPVFGYGLMLTFMAAVAFVSVPAVELAARAAGPLGARLFGVSGRLAGESLQRMPGRTAATVAALALGLSLSAGFTTVAHSFDVSVREWVRSWARRDLFVRSTVKERGAVVAPTSDRLQDALRTLPEVRAVQTYRLIRQRYANETIALASSSAEPLGSKEAIVSQAFARRYRKRVGDAVSLETPRGRRRFRITRVERDFNSDRGTVVVASGTLRRVWGDRLSTDLGLDLVAGADRGTVRREILRRFGAEYHLEVLEPKTVEDDILATVARAFSFTRGIEAVTLLVALLGISDTVLAGVLARRREIGVLRALGGVRRQVAAAFALEGVLIGVLGAALGLLSGLVLTVGWVRIVFADMVGYVIDLHVPVGRLVLFIPMAMGLGAAAAALPARRAARLAVIDALAAE
jgi:putative ABC transport system permease protein